MCSNNKMICVCKIMGCGGWGGKSDKKKIALVDPGSKRREEGKRVKRERERWVGREAPRSDRQRHKAVVLLDVTFENV